MGEGGERQAANRCRRRRAAGHGGAIVSGTLCGPAAPPRSAPLEKNSHAGGTQSSTGGGLSTGMWASASEGQAQARMAAHTRGMKDWAGHFGLVELRKTSGHGACENPNGYAYLTAEVAMPLERYVALPPWEQATARAAAVALTLDTAVVAGTAAARLWGIDVLDWRQPRVDALHVDGKRAGGRCRAAGDAGRAAVPGSAGGPRGARPLHPERGERAGVACAGAAGAFRRPGHRVDCRPSRHPRPRDRRNLLRGPADQRVAHRRNRRRREVRRGNVRPHR